MFECLNISDTVEDDIETARQYPRFVWLSSHGVRLARVGDTIGKQQTCKKHCQVTRDFGGSLPHALPILKWKSSRDKAKVFILRHSPTVFERMLYIIVWNVSTGWRYDLATCRKLDNFKGEGFLCRPSICLHVELTNERLQDNGSFKTALQLHCLVLSFYNLNCKRKDMRVRRELCSHHSSPAEDLPLGETPADQTLPSVPCSYQTHVWKHVASGMKGKRKAWTT